MSASVDLAAAVQRCQWPIFVEGDNRDILGPAAAKEEWWRRVVLAHHEAAHVEEACRLGLRIVGVTIQGSAGYEGWAEHVPPSFGTEDDRRHALAMVLAASTAAEQRCCAYRQQSITFARTDDRELAKLVPAGADPDIWTANIRARAWETVSEHWGAVSAIAAELLKTGFVTGERAEQLYQEAETARVLEDIDLDRTATHGQVVEELLCLDALTPDHWKALATHDNPRCRRTLGCWLGTPSPSCAATWGKGQGCYEPDCRVQPLRIK